MKTIESAFLMIHVIAGFTSLAVFWIPAFNRKGGINHIKIGKIYMWLMWAVVITAGILSVQNFYEANYISAAFLGFLTILSANPLWKGIAILNQKKGVSATFRRKQLAFELLLFLSGLALIGYGIFLGGQGPAVLMFIFGFLGITSFTSIKKLLNNPPQKVDWFVEHGAEMITSGIAAYTAFFAFGGRTFFGEIFTGYWMIIPWVAPTVIGLIAIRRMKKYYARKRAMKPSFSVPTSVAA